MTPLQLGALVASIANGGTLYYLQHPTSPEEVSNFQPRVKRTLDIANLIPDVTVGMEGAVVTARPGPCTPALTNCPFWARPVPAPTTARATGGLLPLPTPPMAA